MRIGIIGAGFSGISAAAYLAKLGHEVHVYEQHDQAGGRARQLRTEEGFVFDMGPSWYWMPDIIEDFFNDFNSKAEDFYELIALDPQFEMVFEKENLLIPSDMEEMKILFESKELGAGEQFIKFMNAASYKYEVGMKNFVHKPCHNWLEFLSPKIMKSAIKLDLLQDFRSYVGKYFSNEQLRILMEFPVIFLGASPHQIPALYSLMNYGGYALGTHYPKGGFYQLVLAMKKIAEIQGVHFHFNHKVQKINTLNGKVQSLLVDNKEIELDYVVGASDYHHTESLLDKELRNYEEQYWEKRTFAPSSLIFYLGFNEKIPGLQHHTLFFEHDFNQHINSIYKTQQWPNQPLFYACCPSKTDQGVAPKGCENLFLLMPLAINLEEEKGMRKRYLKEMLLRIERHTGVQNLDAKIIFQQSFGVPEFKNQYNAYGGNAYGLANTLNQTAILKPKIKNRKLSNMYYAGQLTVPGPGVPPSIISGKIVAHEINKIKH